MLAIVAVAATAMPLAACSSQNGEASSSAAACSDLQAGDASNAVKVSGEFNATPTVDFSTPLDATDLQRTVVINGDGEQLEPDASAKIQFSLYKGADGSLITASQYGDTQTLTASTKEGSMEPGLVKGISCLHVGDRAVVTGSAQSFFEDAASNLGLEATDPVVLIADVIEKADVATADPDCTDTFDTATQMPAVTFDDAGTPQIAAGTATAPCSTQVTVLTQGSGDTVQDGDTVSVHYQGVKYRNGEAFDGNYGGDPTSFATNEVVTGFATALVGQQVGSTVEAVMPPSDAYGASEGHELQHETLVFVLTIESTERAAASASPSVQ